VCIKPRRKGISYIQEKKESNWIGHILRGSCILKHVIDGKLEEIIYGKTRKKK